MATSFSRIGTNSERLSDASDSSKTCWRRTTQTRLAFYERLILFGSLHWHALPIDIDPNEPEMTTELLRLSALGHPNYAKMIDIPMGLRFDSGGIDHHARSCWIGRVSSR
jgi:hypothetical protein